METAAKPLLVFDLDETLIHASKEVLTTKEDFRFDIYFVYLRPYLKEVLVSLSDQYQLAIWSSAGDEYVDHIARQISFESIPFDFTWGHSRCTTKYDPDTGNHFNLKNLKKVKRRGYSLKKTLIIDNTPSKVSANYGNAIYVQDFLGASDDTELLKLRDYLLLIRDQKNYTQIEKRLWKGKFL